MKTTKILKFIRATFPNEVGNEEKLILTALEYHVEKYKELKQFDSDLQTYMKNGRHWKYEE